MELRKYLKEKNIKIIKFANDIEATRDTVQKWLAKKSRPNKTYMPKVVKYTNGKVTPNDFPY